MDIKEKQKTLYSRKTKLCNNATESEILFKKKLSLLGIKFIFQKAFIAGNGYYIVDFYLPKPYKICIEIDGGYHNTPEQKRKDYGKNMYLKNRGFSVIRIKNEDVKNVDILNLIINTK